MAGIEKDVMEMAKGWNEIEQQAQETAAARQRAKESYLPELRVNPKFPGPFHVRFLEQGPDVNNFPVHEYDVPGNTGTFKKRFTCFVEIGQECPGCRAGMKTKRRGVFNLIQRSRPVLRKGTDGKALRDQVGGFIIDGYRDEVVVANVGGPTSEMLRKADADYYGLMSRDFQIVYSGDTFQAWTMTPVMDESGVSGPMAMSEADQAMAAAKHNLAQYMAPPSQQEATEIIAKYVNKGQPGQQAAPTPQAQPGNPFVGGAPAIATSPAVAGGGAFAGAQQPAPVPVPAPVPQQAQQPPAPVAPQPVQPPTPVQ